MSNSNLLHLRGRSRIFPEGTNPAGDLLFCQCFRKLYENARPKFYYVDPPLNLMRSGKNKCNQSKFNAHIFRDVSFDVYRGQHWQRYGVLFALLHVWRVVAGGLDLIEHQSVRAAEVVSGVVRAPVELVAVITVPVVAVLLTAIPTYVRRLNTSVDLVWWHRFIETGCEVNMERRIYCLLQRAIYLSIE